ncbi:hypothetical protein HPB47_006767 [Ixodes persulcatus]|uniref:Uncharacterized protein n=1 Tax=Ixodes persulcatus TaxID=34615 RepID=A0AC60P9X2_IXOPE|nr:hypothetical protein HPB47_006767 [Ixodes persulcatus]
MKTTSIRGSAEDGPWQLQSAWGEKDDDDQPAVWRRWQQRKPVTASCLDHADEARNHEDILHLLQVESVVKRVPSSLTNVRRIVQYARNPEDDGTIENPLAAAPFEAWCMWAFLLVTILALFGLLAFYLRSTASSAAKGSLLVARPSDEVVAVDLDFSEANSKTYFMQNVMKTLTTIEE